MYLTFSFVNFSTVKVYNFKFYYIILVLYYFDIKYLIGYFYKSLIIP